MSLREREKMKQLQRIRRLRGQLDAVERMITADQDDCSGQLMLLAAIHGGVNSLMAEVFEMHVRFHLGEDAKQQIPPELAEDLIDLVRAYLK
jgi:DNA-binding FrmR family transcriptional regulator